MSDAGRTPDAEGVPQGPSSDSYRTRAQPPIVTSSSKGRFVWMRHCILTYLRILITAPSRRAPRRGRNSGNRPRPRTLSVNPFLTT